MINATKPTIAEVEAVFEFAKTKISVSSHHAQTPKFAISNFASEGDQPLLGHSGAPMAQTRISSDQEFAGLQNSWSANGAIVDSCPNHDR